MSKVDSYHTIKAKCEGIFKDRGSKFIAYAYPIMDKSQIEKALEEVKDEHPKARHHCYAWRLGTDKTEFRSNDDGEPSGTAGKPILGQIDSHGITYVLIVVVRYFGGTLLGASGLINAYKKASIEALSTGEIIEKEIMLFFELKFTYEEMNQIMYELKKMDAEILEKQFDEACWMSIAIPQRSNNLLNQLDTNYRNLTIETRN